MDPLGLYAMVYIGTMYLYCKCLLVLCDCDIIYFNFPVTQKGNRSWTILSAVTALFGVTVGQLGLNWQLLQIDFVTNGDTTDSMYNAFIFGGLTSEFVSIFLGYCGNILADGILVSFDVQNSWSYCTEVLCSSYGAVIICVDFHCVVFQYCYSFLLVKLVSMPGGYI